MIINDHVAIVIQNREVVDLKKYKTLCEKGLNSFDRTVLVPFMDHTTFNHFIDSILKESEHELDRTFINPPRTYDDCAIGIIIPELRRRLNHVVNVLQKQLKGSRAESDGG